jgi:hypothetical protein
MPNGRPIGTEGSKPFIREIPGGADAAKGLFHELAKNAKNVTPEGYPGTLYQLPDGGYVGYRPASTSGPPTIDVNIPDIPIKKIKFP